ncbi:hypothetical protein Bca4012_083105 [Brassica carinata]
MEKFQPKKRARSERSVSQKDENPAIAVSTQILNNTTKGRKTTERSIRKKRLMYGSMGGYKGNLRLGGPYSFQSTHADLSSRNSRRIC